MKMNSWCYHADKASITMKYVIEIKPQALKDSKKIPKKQLKRIFAGIEKLSAGMQGDVKRLSHFSPEFRLRIGDYRILFEQEDGRLIIYRIRHRKDVYK